MSENTLLTYSMNIYFSAADLDNLDDDGEMDPETIEKIRIYQV